jgi:hypothetical protein
MSRVCRSTSVSSGITPSGSSSLSNGLCEAAGLSE